jgi:hypothetical protein
MNKPFFQVIDGGAQAPDADTAIAGVTFDAIFHLAAAKEVAARAEHDAFAAAEQVTAAVAILAKDKIELAKLIASASPDQAAETHAALQRALAGARLLVAVLRAAEARFTIAKAAVALTSNNWAL